ncbi:PadR family transcriptional regulator [Enterococcus moraviensis ATCC BAA-383]|uniref:PadR family transcriptional regulator n=1 Tax=Enterococcus moraviensis ATCC BAA-383 TaxID=1158609 RepID=R2QL22_9ENTE|nr:PadR family transcriptional regulator [Enterococcus moraviensis]EOH97297.1 PadR family transcriptional regulator [Enterococcus moraviensis ATCC BAA-383]EOT71643.1 PadR family transcriptional regulator [Enterococcus moraviensis ATCC BAA-383]OJG66715.1 PadR family transcriptional regulator [Enterococcus moraviensis]
MNGTTEMLKGVLEGVILEIINRHETYGYEITSNLQKYGFEDIVEGTVYTILLRLEKKQFVTIAKKKSTVGPMRKFYSLNEAGQKELALFWQRWSFISGQIDRLKEGQEDEK